MDSRHSNKKLPQTSGMDSVIESWSDVVRNYTQQNSISSTKSEQDISKGKLTYGGFISMLQSLGVDHHAARAHIFGTPVGQGSYFSVYRHQTSGSDYQWMWLAVSVPRQPLFQRAYPGNNTHVAIKRIKVDQATEIEVSSQGQLQAICREITTLVHPKLRNHDSIVKLQAIIWENGLSTGNDSGLPVWPSLFMECCTTTLADYQINSPPIGSLQRTLIGSKIGDGLGALHSANIFHGDLKSENVLLKIDPSGTIEPKLADFGCSITFLDEDGKMRYRVVGTPMWWAPECPNYFSTVDEIGATDWYSFALMSLRMHADGRNPFEEFGVIPAEWSPEEKLGAVQFLKDTDCVYALLCGNDDFESLPPGVRLLASMLIKDPIKRNSALNQVDMNVEDLEAFVSQEAELAKSVSPQQKQLNELSEIMEKYKLESEGSDADSYVGEQLAILDPLSLVPNYQRRAFVPDCIRLSKVNNNIAFNKATRNTVVQELTSIVGEDAPGSYPKKCPECCRLSIVDKNPQTLTVETLIIEMKQLLQHPSNRHTC